MPEQEKATKALWVIPSTHRKVCEIRRSKAIPRGGYDNPT
jgi:hypothetical protein